MTSKQEAAREQRLEVAGALDAADVEAQKALATGAPIVRRRGTRTASHERSVAHAVPS